MDRAFVSRVLLAGLLIAGGTTAAVAQSTNQSNNGPQRGQSTSNDDRAKKKQADRDEKERSKRFEKLDKADRAALDYAIGFEAPEFLASIDWVGESGAPSVKSLRGKVVVIQTFTTKSSSSRNIPERVAKALSEFKPEDVQLIAIHTPEGADKAEGQLKAMLEKGDLPMPIGIDRDGSYLDMIGAYKKPVNVVIDRTGDIRSAGLTQDGLVATVKEFVDQPFDPANKPTARRAETSKANTSFPTFKDAISSASDLRGKQAPAMGNVDWWNGRPDFDGKLVVVDFWATWCGPCRQAIPHMNEIASGMRGDVTCVGISDESPSDFDKGVKKQNLKKSDFEYAVGIEPSGSMKKGFGISGIPHVAIISSDGIVRWQGHPMSLTPDVMRQLVEANKSLLATRGGGAGGGMPRWKNDADSSSSRGKSRAKS
ncbi:MAG: redoxin domain-containing protein [Phycisphaerae bacterium]|nr:redoxin domain-containing protein [Phycisphaerae bacterium]